MGHFQRLALLKSHGARGESADAAIRRLRPPVHFARVASLKAQLQKWSEGRIGDALELLLDTEALCKTTAVPSEAVCARALFNVAAMARARLS
jgi:DNA polymerase-3 subunit delta